MRSNQDGGQEEKEKGKMSNKERFRASYQLSVNLSTSAKWFQSFNLEPCIVFVSHWSTLLNESVSRREEGPAGSQIKFNGVN